MSPSHFIQIQKIRKNFASQHGEHLALDGIEMEISQSSIVGIIGKSGSGKSTLMRCMTLLERPDAGRIYIDQEEITSLDSQRLKLMRRKISLVPQTLELLNNRTIWRNIALPLEIAGLARSAMDEKITEMADLVGIRDKLNAYPRQLSGGQKQRVAIARALVTHPKILLCDEFTSALDPTTTRGILSLIRTIRDKTGVTVILITHDMSILLDICEFLYVMDQGQVIESGTTQTIVNSPQHELTKSLLHRHFPSEESGDL